MFVVQLCLQGYRQDEIAELSGYAPQTVSKILSDDRCVQVRQQYLKGHDAEFESLYPEVIEAVRSGLNHADMKFRLDAAEKWLKAHGKYRENTTNVNISAEDVVVKLLNAD
jgi:predicted transcriptional regulator